MLNGPVKQTYINAYAINEQGGIYCAYEQFGRQFIELGSPNYGYREPKDLVQDQTQLEVMRELFNGSDMRTQLVGYNVCIKAKPTL